MREIMTLQCTECKERNYSTTKNKKTTTGRLEFKKFCNRCRKHRRTRKRSNDGDRGSGTGIDSDRSDQSAGTVHPFAVKVIPHPDL